MFVAAACCAGLEQMLLLSATLVTWKRSYVGVVTCYWYYIRVGGGWQVKAVGACAAAERRKLACYKC
jgi:hypothetical protein